ncbi:MAG: O-antigen ligase family protein [Bacteroidetes bacterium]|nr:O-antigen ligase family protein [Bacteroidota bacterium]
MTILQMYATDMRASFQGDRADIAVWTCVIVALATMMFSIAIAQAAVLLSILMLLGSVIHRHFSGASPDKRTGSPDASGSQAQTTPSETTGPVVSTQPARSLLPWVFAAFIIARVIAIPFSIHPALSMSAFRTEIPFYFFFYILLFILDGSGEARLRVIIHLLLLAAVLATIVGFTRYAMGMDARLTSTTAGYYTLGMFLASVFALAFALGRRHDIFPNRIIWMLVCVFLLLGLLFTFNRLHWVSAGVMALLIGVARERRILLVLISAAVLAMLTVAPLQERFMQLIEAGSHMSGRDVLWRGAWMLIPEHPITGFGLHTFREIFPLFDVIEDKGVGSWHNDYLQVYMDSGLLALLPFLGVLVTVFVYAFRNHRRWERGSLQHDLNFAFAVMLVGFALAGGMLDSLLSILFRTGLAVIAVLYYARPPARGGGRDAVTAQKGDVYVR